MLAALKASKDVDMDEMFCGMPGLKVFREALTTIPPCKGFSSAAYLIVCELPLGTIMECGAVLKEPISLMGIICSPALVRSSAPALSCALSRVCLSYWLWETPA